MEEKSPCDGLKLKECKSTKECAWKNKVCLEKVMEEKSPCDGLKLKKCKPKKECAWKNKVCVEKKK